MLADPRVRYAIQVVFLLVFGWLVGATWGTPDHTVTQVLAVLEAFGFQHGEGELALAAAFGSGGAMKWLAERD